MKKKIYIYFFKYEAVFNTDNKIYFLLISEGLCDSKDWSNDAQNSAFHHRNNLLKKKKSYFEL